MLRIKDIDSLVESQYTKGWDTYSLFVNPDDLANLVLDAWARWQDAAAGPRAVRTPFGMVSLIPLADVPVGHVSIAAAAYPRKGYVEEAHAAPNLNDGGVDLLGADGYLLLDTPDLLPDVVPEGVPTVRSDSDSIFISTCTQ